MKGAAVFSQNRHYRYLLIRQWATPTRYIHWLMLNPSTATSTENDPTIRRCIGFTKRIGAEGLMVTNLFAKRATNPRDLKDWSGDIVGPKADNYIRQAHKRCVATIIAWGAKGANYPERIEEVFRLLGYPYYTRLYRLGTTRSGQPRHPLRLARNTPLEVI